MLDCSLACVHSRMCPLDLHTYKSRCEYCRALTHALTSRLKPTHMKFVFFSPQSNSCTRETKAWTHGVHTLIHIYWETGTVCYFVLLKKAPVFCLAQCCSSDRCCVFLQACVCTQTSMCILVYTREKSVRKRREGSIWESMCMHIYLIKHSRIHCCAWLMLLHD